MSDKYNRMAARVRGLTPKAWLVLWQLADLAKIDRDDPDLNRKSWLSQQQLITRTGFTEKTVRAGIKELEDRKLIIVDRSGAGYGGRHQYYINEAVLEEQYKLGVAETDAADRIKREKAAERQREYRARKAAMKSIEEMLRREQERNRQRSERDRL
ncbi:helix-turn-helix domain-containing protein [Rothia sp. LK2588]|uniref:helix-turn-helix domain-containing protein n=1 Tax=Rothia sp. LK2588 TaxID=3114369 RepID=UPI0034CDAFE3